MNQQHACTKPHSTAQHKTTQHSTANHTHQQHATANHTAQHSKPHTSSTTQNTTAQHSTAQQTTNQQRARTSAVRSQCWLKVARVVLQLLPEPWRRGRRAPLPRPRGTPARQCWPGGRGLAPLRRLRRQPWWS
eukprot:9267978-Lingulodinium_polyedra.AAC.1